MDPGGEEQGDWWAEPKKKKSRAAPIAIAVIVLGALGALGWFLLAARPGTTKSAPVGASASAVEDPATLEKLAFAPRTPAADEIFAKRMMAFAIALDQSRGDPDAGAPDTELGKTNAALRSDDVKTAIGERAATELDGVTKAAIAAMRADLDDESKADALEVATARLDNALITARLPYFVDSSVIVDRTRSKRLVLLYEFTIVSSNLYSSGGARVRAVRLRRVDKLNWSHTLLGFVKPRRSQAVVLLDQIDDQLVNYILPALADGAGMPLLTFEAGSVSKEAAGISERAGEHTREEVAALPGIDPAAAKALGESLRVRRALFEHWDAKLKQLGAAVRLPTGLAFDVAIVKRDLKGIAEPNEIADLETLQSRLTAPEIVKAYETLREAYADSVERHEVQHRLDHMNPIPYPKSLDAFVKPDQGPASDAARDRIRAELSAYVAQLARDDRMPRTTFTLIARFLVDPKLRGAAESYSAAIAIEELARELGVTGVAPLIHDGGVDEARLVKAHEGLTTAGPQRLSGAARNVWQRLFGRDLAPLERVP